MRTIIHLSDLHFGTERAELLAPLIALSHELQPDVVVISGDLTQRARKGQFAAARAFLQQLPRPQIVVPGNHDVPLFNVFARFLRPLSNYRNFITRDLTPSYQDDEIKVIGVNTARSLTWKDGRINEAQIAWLQQEFCGLPESIVKIVVTHHPFDLPEALKGKEATVGRAELALPVLQACGADLFLAGHLHQSESGIAIVTHTEQQRQTLVIQAGTAISSRHRGEPNAFNVIRVDHPHVTIQEYSWQAETQAFRCVEEDHFQQTASGWQTREHVRA